MVLVCSNCGKRESTPTATYCRDCYTVFPFEIRAAAQRGRQRKGSLGAWKWLPVGALLAGGALFTQIDFGAPPGTSSANEVPEDEDGNSGGTSSHRAGRTFAGKNDGPAWSTLKDHAPTTGGAGAPRRSRAGHGVGQAEKFTIAPSIAAASRYVGWVLGSDKELACPSVRPCPATISFRSGDQGTYAVERWEGTSNNVVPADEKANYLLNHNFQGRMKMRLPEGRVRSVDLEKKASRWAFTGAGEP